MNKHLLRLKSTVQLIIWILDSSIVLVKFVLTLTMANRRNKGPRGRSRKRRRSKQPPKNSLPLYPPSLSLSANTFTCWIRTEIGISSDDLYWVNVWHLDEVLSDAYKTLFSTFAEYRAKRANLWFIPSIELVKAGITAFACYDDGEDYFITPSLSDVSSSPGSCVKRSILPLVSNWHVTEPSDRNWQAANGLSKDTLFVTALATSQKGNLHGVIIIDTHISFRGLKAASTKMRRSDLARLSTTDAADVSFEHLNMN